MFPPGVASGRFDEPGVKLYGVRDTEMRNARADEGFDGFEFMLLPTPIYLRPANTVPGLSPVVLRKGSGSEAQTHAIP
jgi:hypothetical protein